MTDSQTTDAREEHAPQPRGIPNPFTELVSSFKALKDAPPAFWHTNLAYWLDGVSYFGMLTLLTMFATMPRAFGRANP